MKGTKEISDRKLKKREVIGAGVCRFSLLFSGSMKILHGCEFWGVDKLKSAANFCKLPLALYLEQPTLGFLGFTDRRQQAMRKLIMSPGSMCQSVIFGSLTFRNTRYVVLERNLIFQNFEWSMSCSVFSRQLKTYKIK